MPDAFDHILRELRKARGFTCLEIQCTPVLGPSTDECVDAVQIQPQQSTVQLIDIEQQAVIQRQCLRA